MTTGGGRRYCPVSQMKQVRLDRAESLPEASQLMDVNLGTLPFSTTLASLESGPSRKPL